MRYEAEHGVEAVPDERPGTPALQAMRRAMMAEEAR